MSHLQTGPKERRSMKRFSTFGFVYFFKKIEEISGFILQREELDHCVTKVTHYTPQPSLQNKRTDLTCNYENKRPL